MHIRVVEPVMFSDERDDIRYRCDDCGIETKRTVKRLLNQGSVLLIRVHW